MLTGTEIAFAGLAALAAGLVNALAGGGTLITFPALIALGVPPVAANVTNTVALSPGYLGGALTQRSDLNGQGRRLLLLVPAAVIGGFAGAGILLFTSAEIFQEIVPFLILLGCVLVVVQDWVRDWARHRSRETVKGTGDSRLGTLSVTLASVYGGYFGAGLSVIVLAALGLSYDDSLTRLNALKQCLALAANTAAAVVFVFSGSVVWVFAVVMAIGALAGGATGGMIAWRIAPSKLRWIVAGIGILVVIVLLVRL
jgi:uncharacterized membrane protein YfcA